MIEQTFAPRTVETDNQHEVDATWQAIIRLMDLNTQLDELGVLKDSKESVHQERERLIAELLKDPVRSFGFKFSLLQLLYENRTLTETDGLGTTVDQFVTRNPARSQADLHFRELAYDSGSVERVVEVPRADEPGLPFFVSLKNDTLRIAASVYQRGQYDRVEVQPDSAMGERLLGDFFRHTIVAEDYLSTRSPQEVADADAQARQFLSRKLTAQRTY